MSIKQVMAWALTDSVFPRRLPRLHAAALACGLLLIAACLIPVVTTDRGRLTSDESLYSSEALNIARGDGPTYSTGGPVVHRAPLYPAMMAAAFEVGGVSLDSGAWVSRLSAIVAALALVALVRELGGWAAAIAAGVIVASSSFLNGLGASLFLDSTLSALVLTALLLLFRAREHDSVGLHAAAGAALGAAFLVKESAVIFLILPLLLTLASGGGRSWALGLGAWAAGFLAVTAWWWAWVYHYTGEIFMLGEPSAVQATAALGGAAITAGIIVLRSGRRHALDASARTLSVGALVAAAWGAIFIFGLEWRSWEHPGNYIGDVPAYAAGILAPAFPAAPLAAAAFVWALLRTLRGDRTAAFLVCSCLAFLPFALFSANRELALRDLAPLLYIFAGLTGCAAGWLIAWGRRLAESQAVPALRLAGVVVVAGAVAAVALQGFGRVDRADVTTFDADWDNDAARQTAAWLQANAPAGSVVMSTRLYHSHVHFLTEGRYPVHQLPTVLVEVETSTSPLARPRGTQFRWTPLPERERDAWLYLARHLSKGYFVGLAESDLLAGLADEGVRYVVLNVPDAGFSSPSFLGYFATHPAFSRVFEARFGESAQTVIFEVDQAKLGPMASPLQVTRSAYEALLSRTGGDEARLEALLLDLTPSTFEIPPY